MTDTKLKPYMVYSREAGPCEGAFLVFAHKAREAKRIGYYAMSGMITDEYIDAAVNLLKNSEFLYEQANQEKLSLNIPHVIENPVCCKGCNLWGYELNKEGYCQDCEAPND
jgi:hypothetical protein